MSGGSGEVLASHTKETSYETSQREARSEPGQQASCGLLSRTNGDYKGCHRLPRALPSLAIATRWQDIAIEKDGEEEEERQTAWKRKRKPELSVDLLVGLSVSVWRIFFFLQFDRLHAAV